MVEVTNTTALWECVSNQIEGSVIYMRVWGRTRSQLFVCQIRFVIL